MSRPRNVVIVTLDTVRRDHVSTYGYARQTTPHLQELAGQSIIFERAFAQDVNTLPSHASMFTGLYPHEHGAQMNAMPLAEEQTTLAEILRDNGFRTGAFISGYTLKASASHVDQGFQRYADDFEGERRDGATATDDAIAWLHEGNPAMRYFVFLHLFDAHGPYKPRDESAVIFHSEDSGLEVRVPAYQRLDGVKQPTTGRLNPFVDRYDTQIHYADEQLGRLLREIDLNDTMVIVLADHGETLGERYHALDHGCQLFDEQIRIPLVIALPGARPARIQPDVETIDLLPTVLAALGLTASASVEPRGRDLSPLIRGGAIEPIRYVHSAATAVTIRHKDRYPALDGQRRILSIRTSEWKLIDYPIPRGNAIELYDLAADSAEKTNVFALHQDVARELVAELNRWNPHRFRPVRRPSIPNELEEKMRSLGYIGN